MLGLKTFVLSNAKCIVGRPGPFNQCQAVNKILSQPFSQKKNKIRAFEKAKRLANRRKPAKIPLVFGKVLHRYFFLLIPSFSFMSYVLRSV